jgi:hypothetical protein
MAGKPKSQLERFKEAARELQCDDDVERFEERLGRISKAKAKAKPKPAPAPKRKRPSTRLGR